jgi:flavin-dependent thymidylate synthase
MAGTIPSSWEFVDVTFTITGVSRACAQQITRTRFTPMDGDIFGSYAMQSMRVTELREMTFHVNPKLGVHEQQLLEEMHQEQAQAYHEAIELGIPVEDARGLLPLDTHCNLVVKFNLRQLVDMLRTRDQSLRVQGEYGSIAAEMKRLVLDIWPWSEKFFEPKDAKSVKMIEDVAQDLITFSGLTDFGDQRHELRELGTKLAKAADLLKK